jgi:hypothetical protein
VDAYRHDKGQMSQGVLFAESSDVDWPCIPSGKGNLSGHVWDEADDDAPCGCEMRVTWRQLTAKVSQAKGRR